MKNAPRLRGIAIYAGLRTNEFVIVCRPYFRNESTKSLDSVVFCNCASLGILDAKNGQSSTDTYTLSFVGKLTRGSIVFCLMKSAEYEKCHLPSKNESSPIRRFP